MIIITGWGSKVAAEFRRAIRQYDVFELTRRAPFDSVPLTADRYLFCHGLLRPKHLTEQTLEETVEGYHVNCGSVVQACQAIIAANDRARICIIGSESAYRGSYDGVYAAAKADLHAFVENVRLRTPDQQIVAISPGIVADAGMTTRRTDVDDLERRRSEHPKRRFVTSVEVGNFAAFLLYGSEFVSNTVIRMHGGQP